MGERVDIVVSETGSAQVASNISQIAAAADTAAASVDKVQSSSAALATTAAAASTPLQNTAVAATSATQGMTNLAPATTAASAGLQGMADSAGAATIASNALGFALQFVGGIIAALATEKVVEAYGHLADEFTGIVNRLKLVSTSSKDLAEREQELLEVADKTRGSFAESANLYAKVALASDNLGIESKDLIPVIQTVNEIISLSGATASQAKNGLFQFTEGLEAGTFQGVHLKALLMDLPLLGKSIAQGLGTTTAGLREMGKQGQLSAKEVLDALEKVGPKIEKQFESMKPTISQATQVLKNNVLDLIGTFDQLNGNSARTANTILFISDHLKDFARAIGVAIVAVASFAAAQVALAVQSALVTYLANVLTGLRTYIALSEAAGIQTTILSRLMATASIATQGFGGSIAALWAIIRANPFSVIITLIGAAAAALYFFGNQIKLTSDGSITALGAVVGILKTLWDLLKTVGSYVAVVFTPIWNALSAVIVGAFNAAVTGIKALLDFLGTLIPSLQGASSSLGSFGDTLVKNMKDATTNLQDATLASKDFGDGFAKAGDHVSASAEKVKKSVKGATDELVQMGRVIAENIPPFENLVIAQDKAKAAAERAKEAMKLYAEDVKKAADAVDYLATHTRNAMGDMVAVTDEWARRSGAAFNAVKNGADSLAKSTDTALGATSSAVSSSGGGGGGSSGGGGGGGATTGSRNFSIYTAPDDNQVEAFFKAAGGQDTGIIGAINSLGQEIASGNSFAAGHDIVEVWKRASIQSDAVKNVIKAQFPFLVSAFQGAGLAFANGGSFMVGGSGGTDSQLVQFLASPNEQVNIQTPAQQRELAAALAGAGGGRGKTVIVNMNVSTPDANSFRRSQNQTLLQLKGKLNMV